MLCKGDARPECASSPLGSKLVPCTLYVVGISKPAVGSWGLGLTELTLASRMTESQMNGNECVNLPSALASPEYNNKHFSERPKYFTPPYKQISWRSFENHTSYLVLYT